MSSSYEDHRKEKEIEFITNAIVTITSLTVRVASSLAVKVWNFIKEKYKDRTYLTAVMVDEALEEVNG